MERRSFPKKHLAHVPVVPSDLCEVEFGGYAGRLQSRARSYRPAASLKKTFLYSTNLPTSLIASCRTHAGTNWRDHNGAARGGGILAEWKTAWSSVGENRRQYVVTS